MGIVIGIIVVLLIAGFLTYKTVKSKSCDLLKWIGIASLVAILFTWIIPYGSFSSGVFTESALRRIGLVDISSLGYYAINFSMTAILYLLVLGGFYGILSKTRSYKALVNKLASIVKGHEILAAVIMIVVLAVFTSLSTNTFAAIAFVPFLISVLLNAKFDKVTSVGLTFGSVLVGALGATYGNEGIYYFNYYMGVESTVGLKYRAIVAAFALVLFVVYNIFRVKKHVVNAKVDEVKEDPYLVEDVKKSSIWPAVVILGLLFVLTVLGFIDWSANFGIEAFTDFHTWLTSLTIGDDFAIFGELLGSSASAFGEFSLNTQIILFIVFAIVAAIIDRMDAIDAVKEFGNGIKKMAMPTLIYVLSYIVFIVSYSSPFMAYVTNWFVGLTDSFNPFITTISSLITAIFHADLGYTGYLVGSVITSTYAESLDIAHAIYTTAQGIVGVFMPVSGMLLLGLSYLKLNYKAWFKYIWMFTVAMVIVLLGLVTAVCYIF